MHRAIAEIDQLGPGSHSGLAAESGPANQRGRHESDAGTICLHDQRNRAGRCLQISRPVGGETARLQRLCFRALRLLQQHTESDGRYRP